MFPPEKQTGVVERQPLFWCKSKTLMERQMGLDQYASNSLEDGYVENDIFYWRKHSQLQAFMQEKWDHLNSGEEFNIAPLRLTKEDILDLKKRLLFGILPRSEGGFFFGHQFQDEASERYREQDLKFCEWALEQIDDGLPVYYQCWW